MGLQYSYNQAVLADGLAIRYIFPVSNAANMYLTKSAPEKMDQGRNMT